MKIWKNTLTLNGFDDGLTFTDSKIEGEILLLGSKPINLNSITRFFDCDIEYIEPRKYEFNRNHGDISAAKNDLNWEPQYMPEIGIPMVLDRIFGNK